jgi:hypothetical protein
VPPEVHRQAVGRLVTAGPVFLQTLHYDPIQITSDKARQLAGFGPALMSDLGQIDINHRAEPRADALVLLTDSAAHLIQTRLAKLLLRQTVCDP